MSLRQEKYYFCHKLKIGPKRGINIVKVNEGGVSFKVPKEAIQGKEKFIEDTYFTRIIRKYRFKK